uniref:Uncharacterized protein n=1 Tax=Arundo donax TaxID=35708 RepID=A0A0A9GSA0_ARUDO
MAYSPAKVSTHLDMIPSLSQAPVTSVPSYSLAARAADIPDSMPPPGTDKMLQMVDVGIHHYQNGLAWSSRHLCALTWHLLVSSNHTTQLPIVRNSPTRESCISCSLKT